MKLELFRIKVFRFFVIIKSSFALTSGISSSHCRTLSSRSVLLPDSSLGSAERNVEQSDIFRQSDRQWADGTCTRLNVRNVFFSWLPPEIFNSQFKATWHHHWHVYRSCEARAQCCTLWELERTSPLQKIQNWTWNPETPIKIIVFSWLFDWPVSLTARRADD